MWVQTKLVIGMFSMKNISNYEIFKIPYISLSDRILGKIRNLTYRYMPNHQQGRFFPLQDYDLSNKQQVSVCVYGKILDENYMHVLFDNRDLTLQTVFLLDRVQKKLELSREAIEYLRKMNLVEGRAKNLYISASVAKSVDQEADYIRKKGFEDQYYKDMIEKYLEQFGKAQKKDIKMILWDKLPEILDDKQKDYKIRNILASMKRAGIIKTDSENQQRSFWILDK